MTKISTTDLVNLDNLFKENYYIFKRIKDLEKQVVDINTKMMFKEIKRLHEDNMLTIMKLLDNKERIL